MGDKQVHSSDCRERDGARVVFAASLQTEIWGFLDTSKHACYVDFLVSTMRNPQ